MALFQPTNITPDLKGGVKNGTIMAPYSGVLTTADISWTVNGNSQMVAYQIDFYKNNANSTSTGSTGKVTLGTPFSAISADGTETRYTATLAISYFADAVQGSGTVREGKFKITQWWGTGANDYVEQKSLSVFRYSKNGNLAISSVGGFGAYLNFNGEWTPPFSGTYGDVTLNWTRWQLLQGSNSNIIQDTGKVWGATEYSWSPGAIPPGVNYYVHFSAESSDGADLLAAYGPFDVLQENVTTVSGILSAVCDKQTGAVRLQFVDNSTIYPTTYGEITIDASGNVVIPSTGSLNVTIPADRFGNVPWHFIWHGILTDGLIFKLNMTDNTTVTATWDGQAFFFSPTTTACASQIVASTGDEATIIFTTGYFSTSSATGYQWLVYSPDASGYENCAVVTSYNQVQIASVELCGGSVTTGFTVGFGTQNSFLSVGITDPDASAVFYGPKIIFPDEYYDATALYTGSQLGNDAVYRQDESGNFILIGFFDDPPNPYMVSYLYDYSAGNGGTYEYMVLNNGEENGNAAIATTGSVTPCFWGWDLIEATQSANAKNLYEIQQIFRFRNNVSTSAIGNGGERSIYATFTRYPAVMRGTQNRQSGTLTGLIGTVQMGDYSDTNTVRDAIWALSASNNPLFLRNRRGDFLRIAIAGEITMQTGDNSLKQEQTVSISWIEIGPAKGLSVYGIEWGDAQ